MTEGEASFRSTKWLGGGRLGARAVGRCRVVCARPRTAPYLKAKLVLRSGVGKGSRYRLTTRGVKKAQELVQTLAALIPDPLL